MNSTKYTHPPNLVYVTADYLKEVKDMCNTTVKYLALNKRRAQHAGI